MPFLNELSLPQFDIFHASPFTSRPCRARALANCKTGNRLVNLADLHIKKKVYSSPTPILVDRKPVPRTRLALAW